MLHTAGRHVAKHTFWGSEGGKEQIWGSCLSYYAYHKKINDSCYSMVFVGISGGGGEEIWDSVPAP